jgi:uncharacterized protein (DUF2062 family)
MSSRKPTRSQANAQMARGAAEAGTWLSVPIGFAVWVAVFWRLGKWADDHWLHEPWGQVIGGIVGLAVGFTYLFYAVRVAKDRMQKEHR